MLCAKYAHHPAENTQFMLASEYAYEASWNSVPFFVFIFTC